MLINNILSVTMKAVLIIAALIPALAYGENVSVKTELAKLVEDAVVAQDVDINIPPNTAKETSLEISSVNGVSVCAKEAEGHVKALQNEFTKSEYLRLTYSIYGAYLKTGDGIKYLPPETENLKNSIGDCTNIYVSVY